MESRLANEQLTHRIWRTLQQIVSVEEPLIHLIHLFIFVIQFINQQYQSLTMKHLDDLFNIHKLQNILAISEKD